MAQERLPSRSASGLTSLSLRGADLGSAGAIVQLEPKTDSKPRKRRKNTKQVSNPSTQGCPISIRPDILLDRIRRVKCDETKPQCMRCTNTGRKCDGYPHAAALDQDKSHSPGNFPVPASTSAHETPAPVLEFPSADPILLRHSLLDFQGTQIEHRYLDFFHSQTAPSLAGHFDGYFWTTIVPQIGCSEASVRHAMIALGSFHESFSLEEMGMTDSGLQFALRQYNKAIRDLTFSKKLREENVAAVLTTCILFICLDLLRGNLKQAVDHITGGIRILNAHQMSISNYLNPKVPTSFEMDFIGIFSRLIVQGNLCGYPLPPLQLASTNTVSDLDIMQGPFITIDDARKSLGDIMMFAMPYIQTCMSLKFLPDKECLESSKATRERILNQLEVWRKRMDLFIVEKYPDGKHEDMGIYTLFSGYQNSAIWTKIVIYEEECAWDGEIECFREMVSLARSVTDNSSNKTRKGPYSLVGLPRRSPKRPLWRDAITFEMGILPHLYFTAVRCRDSKLRREAIKLLGLARPRREGFWDARILIKVAKRVVEIEEDGLSGEGLPVEEKRVHDTYILDECQNSSRMQKIVIITKREGEWNFKEEMIPL
ncbi:hypothetical protein BP5796_02804 [Coleophoma crateriformis]|uniref:Zn(2)-C6 fungal-type domain-containing protein n=1 Tax=Coleophoma crateriformis TaxID=565419 RepID=A0A3D8SZG6_9HELO|nr:hypothetical protein BP5796_02804 [Coleophoma crateriformis]